MKYGFDDFSLRLQLSKIVFLWNHAHGREAIIKRWFPSDLVFWSFHSYYKQVNEADVFVSNNMHEAS